MSFTSFQMAHTHTHTPRSSGAFLEDALLKRIEKDRFRAIKVSGKCKFDKSCLVSQSLPISCYHQGFSFGQNFSVPTCLTEWPGVLQAEQEHQDSWNQRSDWTSMMMSIPPRCSGSPHCLLGLGKEGCATATQAE